MAAARVVVVGNGMVAASFLEELAGSGDERFDVTVFGDEPHPAYDRIKFSTVLAGGCDPSALTLLDERLVPPITA